MDFRLVQAPEGYGFGFTELLKERGYHCEGGIEVTLQEAATETIRIAYAGWKGRDYGIRKGISVPWADDACDEAGEE